MQYQQQQQQPPQGYQQEQVIDAYGSYQPAEMQQVDPFFMPNIYKLQKSSYPHLFG